MTKCGSCDEIPWAGTSICRNCGYCVSCAAATLDEGEGLCPVCVFVVAGWAIHKLKLLPGTPNKNER